jgi:hypothetical protein
LVYFLIGSVLRPGYTAVQGHTGMLRVWFICAVLVCCFIRGLHQGRATFMPSFAVIAPQFPRAVAWALRMFSFVGVATSFVHSDSPDSWWISAHFETHCCMLLILGATTKMFQYCTHTGNRFPSVSTSVGTFSLWCSVENYRSLVLVTGGEARIFRNVLSSVAKWCLMEMTEQASLMVILILHF